MSPRVSVQHPPLPRAPSSAPDFAVHPLIFPSLRDTDVAGVCMLVLVLMTAVLTGTGAGPVPRRHRALPGARGCHIAQYKSLSPGERLAFKNATDAFVSLPTAPPAVG